MSFVISPKKKPSEYGCSEGCLRNLTAVKGSGQRVAGSSLRVQFEVAQVERSIPQNRSEHRLLMHSNQPVKLIHPIVLE